MTCICRAIISKERRTRNDSTGIMPVDVKAPEKQNRGQSFVPYMWCQVLINEAEWMGRVQFAEGERHMSQNDGPPGTNCTPSFRMAKPSLRYQETFFSVSVSR